MDIRQKLKSNPIREKLYNHSLFDSAQSHTFTREDLETLLGQYWYPLNYFPTFLSSIIINSPDLETKTSIADILNEELGEGDPSRAHEKFYISSFGDLGYTPEQLTQAKPFEATRKLMACYENGSKDFLVGLGGLYATESTDLAIVSGIGKVVREATGTKDPIPWIDIHVSQEPNHVAQTDDTVLELTPDEEATVIANAEEMWQCWVDFFSAIEEHALAGVA